MSVALCEGENALRTCSVAACCSVLQCVAVWCSVLQCVALFEGENALRRLMQVAWLEKEQNIFESCIICKREWICSERQWICSEREWICSEREWKCSSAQGAWILQNKVQEWICTESCVTCKRECICSENYKSGWICSESGMTCERRTFSCKWCNFQNIFLFSIFFAVTRDEFYMGHHVSICVCMYIYAYVYIYIYIYIYIYTCIYTYSYIYICIYIYTYLFILIYTLPESETRNPKHSTTNSGVDTRACGRALPKPSTLNPKSETQTSTPLPSALPSVTLQHAATHCNTLLNPKPKPKPHYQVSTLEHVGTWCLNFKLELETLTSCNTLQHTATHLQHTTESCLHVGTWCLNSKLELETLTTPHSNPKP